MDLKELMARARSQIGLPITYRLGGGVFTADKHTCADAKGSSDCSSYACWALGIDKLGDYPWLAKPGTKSGVRDDWYGTDDIWHDAVNLSMGLFEEVHPPEVATIGCVIVYPGRWTLGKARPPGHVGIVSATDGFGATKVIHCSSGNFKVLGHAVAETGPEVFLARDKTIYAWCANILRP